MKLFLEAQSERGKAITKSGNEYILMELNAGRDNPVGQIELYIYNDVEAHKCSTNEWLLKYRPNEDTDWTIIAQGNTEPDWTPKVHKGTRTEMLKCHK